MLVTRKSPVSETFVVILIDCHAKCPAQSEGHHLNQSIRIRSEENSVRSIFHANDTNITLKIQNLRSSDLLPERIVCVSKLEDKIGGEKTKYRK